MKIAFFLILAGIGLLWFANETIQAYGLMVLDGEKWTGTTFVGWSMFKGIWFLWVAVAAAMALLLAGLVAWIKFNFEERESELKAKLESEKTEAIAELEKNHASQIENLFFQQTNNSRHLENAYADIEKYKGMLAEQENENIRIGNKIRGRDAVIRRLRKKIDRLETPRF